MTRRRRLVIPIGIIGVVLGLVIRCSASTPAALPPRAQWASNSSTSTPSGSLKMGEARELVKRLDIRDTPPPGGYLRDGWPTWKDIDHDGCDAREQALIAASGTPAERASNCRVLGGSWISAYDGVEVVGPPAGIEIDHLVPLKNAYVSGGNGWSVDRRVLFANDQAELWAVSAASNGSKSDQAPDTWRPPLRSSWCEYATRWVSIKVQWGLTATTSERDALGQMLDTCAS